MLAVMLAKGAKLEKVNKKLRITRLDEQLDNENVI